MNFKCWEMDAGIVSATWQSRQGSGSTTVTAVFNYFLPINTKYQASTFNGPSLVVQYYTNSNSDIVATNKMSITVYYSGTYESNPGGYMQILGGSLQTDVIYKR